MSQVDAVLFDAYGTLFNVHAAARRLAGRLGDDAGRLSEAWRLRQLEYTWLRACMERYVPFWQVTGEALDHAMSEVGIDDSVLRDDLLATYRQVEVYPDVVTALQRLRAAGVRTGVFSNADPAMLGDAVHVAGLEPHLDEVISVDEVGTFKPRPEVYAHAKTRVGGGRVGFVSANGWDVAGATSAGLRAVWVNRIDAPVERLGVDPYGIVASLEAAVMALDE